MRYTGEYSYQYEKINSRMTSFLNVDDLDQMGAVYWRRETVQGLGLLLALLTAHVAQQGALVALEISAEQSESAGSAEIVEQEHTIQRILYSQLITRSIRMTEITKELKHECL